MQQLTIVNKDGQLVTDSREIATMINKKHFHLMRDIKEYVNVLDMNPKLDSSDFFIESTYLDAYKREKPCYLITKKGCDMIANKMTGEKGILFTATYVTQFDEMRNTLINMNNSLIANNVLILRDTKSFTKSKTKKTFESVPICSIPYVYKEFKDYLKSIDDKDLKLHIVTGAYKGIKNNLSEHFIDDFAINNQFELLDIKLELLETINKLNKSLLIEHKRYIDYIDPPIENYNVINVHPFTCNKLDDYAYSCWKTNFPVDEFVLNEDIDFNKKVNIWLKFDHLEKFDVTNFSKTFIDKVASILKVDDKNIQLKECSTNKIVDSYSDGKIYYIISQDL